MQNFYQLLSVEPASSADEIKRAFRNEIARYHPDKVQHLGKEFQELAAERAAQLTEAYRTLMNAELRADYDRALGNGPGPSPEPPKTTSSEAAQRVATVVAEQPAQPAPGSSSRFAAERATRDEYVRKATVGRLRKALADELGNFEELRSRAFDASYSVKPRGLFSRAGTTRFAIKFVSRVDRVAVQEAWAAAAIEDSASAAKPDHTIIFLVGTSLAPVEELAATVSDLRKRPRGTAVSLVPVDARDWSAHVPTGAPSACKQVLERLRHQSVA